MNTYYSSYSYLRCLAYDVGIGDITGQPTYFSTTINSPTVTSTVSGTQADLKYGIKTTEGNVSGGIAAIYFQKGYGYYQIGFTPKIPKTTDNTLSLTFRHSWSRKES
jgi:hypothetical protein